MDDINFQNLKCANIKKKKRFLPNKFEMKD